MQIDYSHLLRLEKAFGEPFFLFDSATFRRNYDDFLAAFRTHYPPSEIAYSYKTNYLPAVCRMVNDAGGYAEVVSGLEYEIARKIGVAPQNIIFNGPFKTEAELRLALNSGSIVNLDGAYELALVERIAGGMPGKSLNIGVRCNFNFSGQVRSRFGFDTENGFFGEVIHKIRSMQNCHLAGFHCHYMPRHRSCEEYSGIAERMVKLTLQYFPETPPDFIDLGGGFFSRMKPEFARQFGTAIPSFEEYGEAIGGVLKAHYGNAGPQLILEPGMALVADAFKFVTKVIDIKIVGKKSFALVSGSKYNVKPTGSTRNLPIQVISPQGCQKESKVKTYDIAGYTCMEDDIPFRQVVSLI